ncbi:MAG: hypothetical protein HZA78_04960 [Candidatus Schekmanbacteria bacterium]|nr:hypothetical protein [Candidatus Schekmanbacteria bacterium]
MEMIIVMIIAGLLAALAAPRIGSSLSNLRLNTSARHLAAVLRNTRSKAIADKKTYPVVFAPEGNKYSYPGDAKEKEVILPEDVQIKELRDEEGEDIAEAGQILFFPKGNSSGGRVTMTNEKEQVFYIKVETISGRVRILRDEDE